MKVLINRTTNRISGAEIYNLYLLSGLNKYKDIELTFSSDNLKLNNLVKKIGVHVIPVHSLINEIGTKRRFLYALLILPFIVLNYWKEFKSFGKFDLAIFESMNEKIFLTIPLKFLGKKVIWIEHGPLFVTQRTLIIKKLYKFMSKYVDKIICVSKSTKLDLLSGGINNLKLIMNYIGVDTNHFLPADEHVKSKLKQSLDMKNDNIIGFLGTVNKEKGIYDFLEVATMLLEYRRNVIFIVIGGGEELENIKDMVKKRNLQKYFTFTDHISDVKKYLSIVDVLLFPSHHNEGLPVSLLEALSMGTPVVASNMSGNTEIVKNMLNGYVYKNSSYKYIKNLIIRAIRNRKTLSKKSRQIAVEKFSLNTNIEQFYYLFNHVYYEK